MSQTPVQNGAAPKVEGAMFLFSKPELLTKEQHGGLGLSRPAKPYGFAANVRAIPLTVTEFTAAQKNYPIIFSDEQSLVPLAVVGMNEESNLFVEENGEWAADAYIPGYIRRYPFAFANDKESDRFAVIVDADAEVLKAGGEVALFNGDGLSDQTQRAIDFCKSYEQDRRNTEVFAKKLKDLGIISPQQANYKPDGAEEEKTFASYVGIDETKFRELGDDAVLDLHKTGMLPFLYAQLMSMANWRRLLERRARKLGITDPNQIVAPSA